MTSQSAGLFGTTESKPEPAMPPDWLNVVARKKLGQPPEWRWCNGQVIGETRDFLVEGGVPRELKSGIRKGLPTWKDAVLSKCVVTDAEIRLAQMDYEIETGKCWECAGSGEKHIRWNHKTGNQFADCPRCDATGKSPEVRP